MIFRLSSTNPSQVREETSNKTFKSKVFIVTEGKETEINYFKAFIQHYQPNLLNDFILLERLDSTRSHPSYITKQIDNLLNFSKDLDSETTEVFEECKDELQSCQGENDEITKKIRRKIKKVMKDNKKFEELFGNSKDSNINFHASLEVILSLERFEKDLDKVMIVIDRDRQSFKPQQYDEVIKIAQENNYHLGITNPCFELFLYLHFADTLNLLHHEIAKNPRVNKKQRYMEDALKQQLKGHGKSYTKSEFDANFIVKNFKNVEENLVQSGLSTDIYALKNSIGTSLNEVLKQYL